MVLLPERYKFFPVDLLKGNLKNGWVIKQKTAFRYRLGLPGQIEKEPGYNTVTRNSKKK